MGLLAFLLLTFVLNISADPQSDGIIQEGEYKNSESFAEESFEFHWSFIDDTFYGAILANTKGWVAVGFDPQDVMEGADMVIGWVSEEGEAQIIDCFSTGPFGPHPPDVELGGMDNLIARRASEKDGITIVEFIRKMDADDPFDKSIQEGSAYIWAYATTDTFDAYHSQAGYGVLSGAADEGTLYDSDKAKTDELARNALRRSITLVLPHALSLGLSFIFMMSGMLIARYGKKNKKWLVIHRSLGYAAALLAAFGLVMGFRLAATMSGVHFSVPHAFYGAITLLGAFMTPILGKLMFTWKVQAKRLRLIHRIVGRLTILLMGLTIVSGLFQAGILRF